MVNERQPLISIIIPVYNIEKYIRQCLDSVINQTYRYLEILVVDDGSTDGSGKICDEYAEDNRVKIIHQTNKGLSGARNVGIDIASGSFILLVDGDDYIELNTVECLLKACLDTNADVSCCGHYKEYTNKSISHALTKKSYEGKNLTSVVMEGSTFGHYAWGKLYKKELFNNCRFPEDMLFEDIATTWKLLIKCQRVTCISDVLFHYVYRKDSLGNTKTMKNLVDRWIAFKDRYDEMAGKSDELKKICTKRCLDTIGYTWRWLYIVKDKDEQRIQEMRLFAEMNRDNFQSCSVATRISLFFVIHSNTITIAICYYLNRIYRRIRGMDQMA